MIKWRSNCHGIKGQVIVGMFYEKELQKKKKKNQNVYSLELKK